MYEMKDEYMTGIQLIDDEHTGLFNIAEEAYQLLHNDLIHDKYDKLTDIIDELRDYTRKHFADEEEYMRSIGYKKIFTQIIEHNAFIEKLEDFDLEDADENQEEAVESLLTFLTEWLINHILEVDMMIGK